MGRRVVYDIVGHREPDLDCIASMIEMKVGLMGRGIRARKIRYHFVNQGQTFEGVTVDPTRFFEVWVDERGVEHRIYHVDCGLSRLDHHRDLENLPPSAVLVARFCKLPPEWQWVTEGAALADQNGYRDVLSLPGLLLGTHRDGRMSDLEIVRQFENWVVPAFLASGRLRVAAANVPVNMVDRFPDPGTLESTVVLVRESRSFGRVALIVAKYDMGHALANRLRHDDKLNCRLIISLNVEDLHVGVLTGNRRRGDGKRNQGQPRLCLLGLGIVEKLRAAEAKLRRFDLSVEQLRQVGKLDEMPVWFAHLAKRRGERTGRVVGVLNGSRKAQICPERRTLLSEKQIVQLVLDCIVYYAEHGSAIENSPTQ